MSATALLHKIVSQASSAMAARRIVCSIGAVLLLCSGACGAGECEALDDQVGLMQTQTEIAVRSPNRLGGQSAHTADLQAKQPPSIGQASTMRSADTAELRATKQPAVAQVSTMRSASAADLQAAPQPTEVAEHFEDSTPSHTESLLLNPALSVDYGNEGCKCIGLDGVPGETWLTINGTVVKFPSNFGSRCAPWYHQRHPACLAEPTPDWCTHSFCYVDPCKCTQSQVPRVDPYNKGAKWKNMRLYYSFATCGSVDTFTLAENKEACVNQKTQTDCDLLDACSWSLTANEGLGGCIGRELSGSQCDLHQQDEFTWGHRKCACQGMAHMDGALTSLALNVSYPGETGASCKAWHNGVHPDCLGPSPRPSWCTSRWCFVDPCECSDYVAWSVSASAKVDNVFPGGGFHGTSLFYSYETCSNYDSYTETMNPNACSLQRTEQDCDKQDRCMWSGWHCRGIEVATNCLQTF